MPLLDHAILVRLAGADPRRPEPVVVKDCLEPLFTPTFQLVQELLVAKRGLELPRALRRLDLFDLVVLDDIGYVQQTPDEIEVPFTSLPSGTSAGSSSSPPTSCSASGTGSSRTP